MTEIDELVRYLPLLIPVLLVQLALLLFALLDLLKRPDDALRGSRMMWVLIIVLVNIVGPIIYFVAARQDE